MPNRVIVWLLVVALSVALPAAAVNYKANLILPLSGPKYNIKYQQWASIAQVAALNATQHWISDTLSISIFDSQSDLLLSSRLVVQSIENTSVIAVIGFGDEISTKEAARYLDAASMPLLSPSSRTASPLLSMLPHENYSAALLMGLMDKFEWTRISAFYAFDGSVDGIKSSLDSNPDLDITWVRLPYIDPSGPMPSYSSTVQAFVKSGTTVGVILSNNPAEVAAFLAEAEVVAALGSGKAMVVVGVQSSSPALSSVPLGTIFIDELESDPSNTADFIDFVQQLSTYPLVGPGATVYPQSIEIYDAVFALVDAIDVAKSTQVTRGNVLNALKSVDFVGYSGRVHFNSDGFRPSSPANIVNKKSGSTFSIPIYYNGSHFVDSSAPVFLGGALTVPDDQIDLIPIVFFMPLSPPAAPFPRIIPDLYFPFILDLINNEPGMMPPNKKLAILLYDDKNSPITAIQLSVPLPNLGIAGVIGSLVSPMCINIQNVISPFNIPHLAFSATSQTLSDKQLYPTFMRNIPPATFDLGALVGLCRAYGWKEVTFVYSEDQAGGGTVPLIDMFEEQGITVENRISLPIGATNYDEQVDRLKSLSPRIVVFLATFDVVEALGGSLFRSGFKPDAWVSIASLIGGDLAATAQSFGAPSTFFDNWIVVATSGGRGPKYAEFMAKLNAVPSPSPFDVVKFVMSLGSPYPIAIADSFYVYADSIRRVVESGGDPRNGTHMLKAMYETNTELLTGPLSFDSNGDRIGPYEILNVKNAKGQVMGTWTASEGVRLTTPLRFMDGTTNIPASSYPRTRKWLFWTGAPAIIFAVLAGIGLLISVGMIFVIIHQRNAPPIASATWQFLVVMLLGIGLGYGSVFTWIGEPAPYICALRIWLPAMALILIMAPLLAKTWRLHRIFTLGSLKITPIPLWKLIAIAGALILVQLVICIVWISVGTIQPTNINDSTKRTIAYAVCSQAKANQIASYVTYGYFGLIMLVGAYYAFRVRNLPKDFNESRWIGFSIYNTLLFGVIIIILGYALSSFPITVLILICVCTLAIATGTMGLMLAPKIWTLWKHPEKRSGGSDRNSRNSKASSNYPRTSVIAQTKHNYSRRNNSAMSTDS